MSTRSFILLFLAAALAMGATYFYTSETEEVFSDPGLTDLVRQSKNHGWPWGYYAEVEERVQINEYRVAIIEYNEIKPDALFQTFIAWFVFCLIASIVVLILITPPQQRP
jgi:hypothetical protein